MRCKIGRHACHNINIDNKILKEAGLYWFCDECNQQFMSEYINKLDKNVHFNGFNENEKDKGNRKSNKKNAHIGKIKVDIDSEGYVD